MPADVVDDRGERGRELSRCGAVVAPEGAASDVASAMGSVSGGVARSRGVVRSKHHL